MFPQVIPHTPPQHVIRVHRIMTDAEQRQSRRGREAVKMQAEFTRQKRAENALLGKERSKEIDQLVRVTWCKPFTVSDIVAKARLLGYANIDKKVYSRRLATLADKGTIVVIGKVSRETLYQARGAK